MAEICGLSPDERREASSRAGRATAWYRHAAHIVAMMSFGFEDDTNPELSAAWDMTMKRWFP